MSDPIPATILDPNVWYHITEQAVDPNHKNDFKAMLQTNQDTKANDTHLHVWPVKTDKQAVKAYWQFQPVESTLGRFINVHNGTKFHLGCIPNGPVFMNPDVDDTPYQTRQHWLMTSALSVNNKAFSTTISEVSSSTSSEDNPTSTAGSGSSSSSGNNFSSGEITGISVEVVLGVIELAISLAAFFLWRARSMRNRKSASPGSTTKGDKGRGEDSSVVPPYQHFSPEDVERFPKCTELDGDPVGAKLPSNQRLNSETGTYNVSVLSGYFPLRSSLNNMMLSPNPQKDAHPTKIVTRTDSSIDMADFSTPLTALRATAKTQPYATAIKQAHNATTGFRYSDVSYHQFEIDIESTASYWKKTFLPHDIAEQSIIGVCSMDGLPDQEDFNSQRLPSVTKDHGQGCDVVASSSNKYPISYGAKEAALRPVSPSVFEFVPLGDDQNAQEHLVELVVPPESPDFPHYSLRDATDGKFHTGDLFLEIALGEYAFKGRDDDWIKMEMSLRCDANSIEVDALQCCGDDLIHAVVAIGVGCPSPATVIEPKHYDDYDVLESTEKTRELQLKVLQRITPFHRRRYKHERIEDVNLIFVVPQRPLPRTNTKGNIRRLKVEGQFKQKLDEMFK
ncbi:hypothetical protein LZL87_006500 [Fusarium oxysporum]|nr:hypothetical protein LZL87_006500 [Fusarium oxysporum]